MNDARLAPAAGFGPVFTWGLRLVFRGGRFVLVAAFALGVGALLGYAGVREVGGDPVQALARVLDQSVLRYVLPLVALTLVAQGYAREVSDRTLLYHLVRPVSRTTVFLARYLSGLLPAAIVSALLLGGLFATAQADVPASAIAGTTAVALVGTVAVGAVYYVLAALLKHGVVAGLVYTFVFEGLITSVRGSVQKLSVMFHVRSLHHRLTDHVFEAASAAGASEGRGGLLGPAARIEYDEPLEAVIWLLAITVVFLAFGVWRTKRRDFPLKD